MKLSKKIHLYTAVLFIGLLIFINISIYLLFKNLIIAAQTDSAEEETLYIIEGVTSSLGTVETGDLLRAYVPVDGKIDIVTQDHKKADFAVSPTQQALMKHEPNYYHEEAQHEITVDKIHYYFHSFPVILPDGTIANIQVVKSLEPAYEQIKVLGLVLISVTVITMIPIIVSSRFLSKIIMSPIQSLTKTMKNIIASGKFQRIRLTGDTKDELSQMGQTFNHMIDMLEENFTKQEQFVSNASHELKTPLTVIESYASLLKRRGMEKPEVFQESIEAIHSEAIRMKEMTEQLLLMAKPKEQWNLEFVTLSPTELLESVIKSFQNAYARTIHLIEEEPITITTDEKRLKQLIYIILENAIKYSEEDIKVVVGKKEKQGFIRVIDRGIGIPKEDLKKVFDRFYRVDKARARKFGGTGLGLSLAKEISEAIDATIDIDSALDVGTSVTIYFN